VTQALRCAAARQERIDPDRLSFMETLRVLRCRLPACVSRQGVALTGWFRRVLAEIAAYRLERRRPRINPRVVKHQVSNYAKKHPHHRGLPSQRQPFLESVVMLI
jgi:hypothetical protein